LGTAACGAYGRQFCGNSPVSCCNVMNWERRLLRIQVFEDSTVSFLFTPLTCRSLQAVRCVSDRTHNPPRMVYPGIARSSGVLFITGNSLGSPKYR
jgi:hypothetical protein